MSRSARSIWRCRAQLFVGRQQRGREQHDQLCIGRDRPSVWHARKWAGFAVSVGRGRQLVLHAVQRSCERVAAVGRSEQDRLARRRYPRAGWKPGAGTSNGASAIESDLTTVNNELQSVGKLSTQIIASRSAGQSTAALEDQRDGADQVPRSADRGKFMPQPNGDVLMIAGNSVIPTRVDPTPLPSGKSISRGYAARDGPAPDDSTALAMARSGRRGWRQPHVARHDGAGAADADSTALRSLWTDAFQTVRDCRC